MASALSVAVQPVLTIVIPTYNRNEKLKRCIDMLIPQLYERVITHVKNLYTIYNALEQPRHYSLPTSRERFLLRQIYSWSLLTSELNKYFFL